MPTLKDILFNEKKATNVLPIILRKKGTNDRGKGGRTKGRKDGRKREKKEKESSKAMYIMDYSRYVNMG